jgi:hypothetical protein
LAKGGYRTECYCRNHRNRESPARASAEESLHYAWDEAVVAVLEQQLGTHAPDATARKLEALYPAATDLARWKPGESEQIAWESHQLVEADVYRALGDTGEAVHAGFLRPATRTPVTLSSSYTQREAQVAGRQLAKAGYRLAGLLNKTLERPRVQEDLRGRSPRRPQGG